MSCTIFHVFSILFPFFQEYWSSPWLRNPFPNSINIFTNSVWRFWSLNTSKWPEILIRAWECSACQQSARWLTCTAAALHCPFLLQSKFCVQRRQPGWGADTRVRHPGLTVTWPSPAARSLTHSSTAARDKSMSQGGRLSPDSPTPPSGSAPLHSPSRMSYALLFPTSRPQPEHYGQIPSELSRPSQQSLFTGHQFSQAHTSENSVKTSKPLAAEKN